MNRNEKLIAMLLGLLLVGYLGWQHFGPKPTQPPASVPPTARAATPPAPVGAAPAAPPKPAELTQAKQSYHTLENAQVRLTFSDLGARLVKAELLKYPAANVEGAPHVTLETGELLALSWADLPAVPTTATRSGADTLVFRGHAKGAAFVRTVRLGADYAVDVRDAFSADAPLTLPAHSLSLGALPLGGEKGDTLSADTLAAGERKPVYREGKLGKVLGARSAFLGCGTSSDPAGLPLSASEAMGPQTWVALKSRFFAMLAMPGEPLPARLVVTRSPTARTLEVTSVGGALERPALDLVPGAARELTTRLYVGPKELSSLNAFGAHAGSVMDFGMFAWLCGPLLWVLNFFHGLIPNYGVAIILLTLLVRVAFWPLTHKSTVSMRKMSVIQPQIKELQKKFKDQPQKLQQETFKLYREQKVNPFSSCLPMLVQIPIFIALFTVLRAAVELRFASFLWISDLSQPENLLAGVLPMPLNILPILTAVTMGLQTHLSPSTGDPAQKKMMTWMMPIMLLFMFYSMPSALCLYWTVSQALSILQMWHIQRSTAREAKATA